MDVWVTDEQLLRTLEAIPGEAFTLFDFIGAFSDLYPDGWTELVVAFGVKGDGRGRSYTAEGWRGDAVSAEGHTW